ncbi:MAG: phosphopantetheine-binding protein [Polyangiaceae bacterium]
MLQPHLDYERIVEQTIFSKLRALLTEKFGIAAQRVELDSTLVCDLGIEAADMAYLALTLEAAFDVDITSDDAARIVRVRDAVRCILGVRA